MITNAWHSWLGMRNHSKAWYEDDLVDELQEYNEETKLFMKWSELSDVVYAQSRARWNGYDLEFPLARFWYFIGLLYMFPKYTGRWLFFKRAGYKAGSSVAIREVRNPKKVHKLHSMAKHNDLDPVLFENVCKRQLRYWPLLP